MWYNEREMSEQESQFVPQEEQTKAPEPEKREPSEIQETEVQETEQAEKLKVWQEKREGVEEIVDKIGEPIDEGVKESVTAMNVNGFETSASCEGHLDHGESFPWVDVGESPSEEFLEKTEKVSGEDFNRLLEENPQVEELIERNHAGRERLRWMLDEFYDQSREEESEGERLLTVSTANKFGGFRVLPREALIPKESVSPQEQNERLQTWQEEMQRFTEFLRERYFDPETENKERAYQEFLESMDELRSQVHEDIGKEREERIASNPEPTEEELRIGAFKEDLEPQVRDAVFQFSQKGYSTNSSGFYGGGRQAIDGFFQLDDETIRKLEELGVKVRDGFEADLPGWGDRWTRIEFLPDRADMAEMKRRWDAITMLLPEKEKPAAPSTAGGSYDFRKTYGRDRIDIEIEARLNTEEAQSLDSGAREKIGGDLKRGGWDFIDVLEEKTPQNMEEYNKAADEFFKNNVENK